MQPQWWLWPCCLDYPGVPTSTRQAHSELAVLLSERTNFGLAVPFSHCRPASVFSIQSPGSRVTQIQVQLLQIQVQDDWPYYLSLTSLEVLSQTVIMAYIKAKDVQSFFSSSYHSVIHFNSRSLRKHCDEFHALVSLATHPFLIICVSETWLSDADKNLYCFPSYNSEYSHRVTSSHGGAAIFLLYSINYRCQADLCLKVVDWLIDYGV